ncbi:hypothetical protein L2737_11555 [Shewanella electrodiphila]|uniref:GP-PDE domain-containing protein n=1 Tax=Shewanella electrodiphila TaxID=934143 RepID=A0ABT0KQ33_9GAMM|nr:glycerophosphodiester phosphodiesterase family protein [Shewanella electrodiphila]MCL1045961.1 hypothetical protein [Shewanella electrodiphila]
MRKYILFLLVLVFSIAQANTGHRLGGDVYSPENTLYSFKLALQKLQKNPNFHNAEFDIQESKDGYPVVFHDVKNISRVVPYNNFNHAILSRLNQNIISNKSFEDISISNLYLHEIKALKLENDARIPELFEVLDTAVEYGLVKPMQVEIKHLNTDKCRMEVIETVSKYKDRLNINFLAFQNKYNKSFPDPIRWGAEFQKHDFKVYTSTKRKVPSNVLSAGIPLEATSWKFTTLIDKNVYINNPSTRVIEFPISINHQKGKSYALNIGLRHGIDDSGDKGLEVHLYNKNRNKLKSFFSKNKGWKWKTTELNEFENLIISIVDKDTSFSGKYPGNKAQLKVNLVEK